MQSNSYRHADPIFVSLAGHTLWVGDCQAAQNINWLKQKNIRTVITAADGFEIRYDPSIRHIVYKIVDIKSHKISNYFDIAAYQIHKSLKSSSVLVHCGAGVSRSASLVIAYLIRYQRMSFKQALKYSKQKRPQICPNLGFELQLKMYEKKKTELLKNNQSAANFIQNLGTKKSTRQYVFHQKSFSIRQKPIKTNRLSLIENSTQKDTNFQRTRQLNWLTKIAEFRFGSTNLRNWRLPNNRLEKSLLH